MKTRRSDKKVAGAVKAFAGRLGLQAASRGGHALRSGLLTSAAARGFQAGRSVAAQEHGHAAGSGQGRINFQAPCRGRLAVRSLFSRFTSGARR